MPRRPPAGRRGRRRHPTSPYAGRRRGSPAGPAASPRASSRATASWSPRPTATSSSCSASPWPGPAACPCRSTHRCSADEIDHVVADSGAALRPAHAPTSSTAPAARPRGAGRPGDVAALFYTSGTTGKPKGAALTHRGLVGQLGAGGAVAGGAAPRRSRRQPAGRPHHGLRRRSSGWPCAGIPVLLLAPLRRRRACSTPSSAGAPRVFVGVPAMYRMLLEAGAEHRDLRSVRVWVSGADAMPPELARRFKQMGATATLPLLGARGRGAVRRGLRHGRDRRRRHRPALARRSLGLGPALPAAGLQLGSSTSADEDRGTSASCW